MNIVLVADVNAGFFGSSENVSTFIGVPEFAEALREKGHHVILVVPDEMAGEFTVPYKTRRLRSYPGKFAVGQYDEAVIRRALDGADIAHFILPFDMCTKVLAIANEMGIPCLASFPCAFSKSSFTFDAEKLRRRFFSKIAHIHCPSEQDAQEILCINVAAALHVVQGADELETLYQDIISGKAQSVPGDGHKIHLKQTKTLILTEEYRFVNRNPLFLVLSSLFKFCFIFPIFFTITKLGLGFKARGLSNLKKVRGGAVTVSNHVHMLDAPMISFSLFPRQPVITSLKGNFETPGVRFLVKTLGAAPIPETPKALGAFMRAMMHELSRKRLVHFYPEAALWPGHTSLRPFKSGAFHLAVSTGKPVLPMVVKQRDPRGLFRLFKKKPCITVLLGEPVPVPEYGTKRQRIDMLCKAVHSAMESMLEENQIPDSEKEADVSQ